MSVIIRPQSLALAGIPRTSPASQPGQPMKLIIPGMNKPNRVFNGVMMCGDCGRPLKHGAGVVSPCKNPACARNKPATMKPN
jgi:hypothetical protein